MKFFKDVLDFEKSGLKDLWGGIKESPERLLMGSVDPASTKLWNALLNRDDKPLLDQMGGQPNSAYDNAEARGVDTRAGKGMHYLARAIAAYNTGAYVGGLGGGMGGGSSGGGGMGGGMGGMPKMPGMGGMQTQQAPQPPQETENEKLLRARLQLQQALQQRGMQ